MPRKIKPVKSLWLVESANEEENESFLDVVPAQSSDEAEQIIAEVRDYATVTYSCTPEQHLADAKRIAKLTLAEGEKCWREFLARHGDPRTGD